MTLASLWKWLSLRLLGQCVHLSYMFFPVERKLWNVVGFILRYRARIKLEIRIEFLLFIRLCQIYEMKWTEMRNL